MAQPSLVEKKSFGLLGVVSLSLTALVIGASLWAAISAKRPRKPPQWAPIESRWTPEDMARLKPTLPRPSSSPSMVPQPPARQGRLKVGDVGVLDDGDTLCALATDDEAWDLMLGIQNAGGSLMPLVRTGRVIPAARGTRVRVIGSSFTALRVQLEDGPFAGEIGWIQAEFVRP